MQTLPSHPRMGSTLHTDEIRRTRCSPRDYIRFGLAFVLLLTSLLILPTAQAQVTTFCADLGHFGTDCSLEEILSAPFDAGHIIIDETRFEEFQEGIPDDIAKADKERIRVLPIGEGTNTPGLRFEFVPRPGFLAADLCELDASLVRTSIQYTVGRHTIPGQLPSEKYDLIAGTLDMEFQDVGEVIDGQPRGGWVEASLEAFLFNQTAPTRDFFTTFPTEPMGQLPLTVKNDDFAFPDDTPTTLTGILVGLTAGALPSASPDPEDECGVRASISAVEQRVQLVGPIPPLPSAGFIENGDFTDGLMNWDVQGSGSTELTDDVLSMETSETDPIAITQNIPTPDQSFELVFDYRFQSTTGSLSVSLNGEVLPRGVFLAPATMDPSFTRARIYVNNPVFMGLTDAELKIEVHPGSITTLDIAQISILSADMLPDGLFGAQPEVGVIASAMINKPSVGFSAEDEQRDINEISTEEVEAFVTQDLDNFSKGTAKADLVFGGGIKLRTGAISASNPFGRLFRTESFSIADGLNRYRVVAEDPMNSPTTPVDVDVALNISGELENTGQAKVVAEEEKMQVIVSVGGLYANTRVYDLILTIDPVTGPQGETLCFLKAGNCPPGAVWSSTDFEDIEPVGNGTRVRTSKGVLFPDAIHASVGSEVVISFSMTSQCIIAGLFCEADFNRTLEASVSTNTPGVKLVPVGDPQPPDDTTPPIVMAIVSPAPNPAGWHNTDVQVDFSGNDVGGESDPVVCNPLQTTLTGEGANQPAESTCVDQAGNEAIASTTVSIDKTTPTVQIDCPATVEQNQAANADVLVSDTLSGVASQSAPNGLNPLDTSTVGVQQFSVKATDVAGNQHMSGCDYTVEPPAPTFTFEGFFTPVDNAPEVNQVKAGQGIALKWRLRDSQGALITDIAEITSLSYHPTMCSDGATLEESEIADASGQSGLRFDETDEQFVYVWKSPKSLQGSCADFIVGLSDGTTHVTHFAFK